MPTPGYGAMPGISALQETTETALLWGDVWTDQILSMRRVIVSTAVDAGNTPTTVLRRGLLLGMIASTGKLKAFDPTATDGSGVVWGILGETINMVDPTTNTARDRTAIVFRGGPVRGADLLILGTAFNSAAGENLARRQMALRYIFDDTPNGNHGYLGLAMQEVAKTADYAVLEADHGTLFTTAGAAGTVIFTLPTIRPGLAFEFYNLVDQTMTVASAEGDNIFWDHDVDIDSLSFSTSSHKIGGRVQLEANAAGTKWYVRNLSPATCTVTAAD